MSRLWEWSQVKLGDIRFTQDNVRESFSHHSRFRSLCDSIAAFKKDGDPDISLSKTNAYLEVVSRHNKLFSLDNRRLFCLKEVFDIEQKLWVKLYSSTYAYGADHRDCSWEKKFSTINDGVSVVVLPRGFKGNVPAGMDFRCLRLPLGYEPPAVVLNKWKEKYNFDDMKVERDAMHRDLRVLIVYGDKRDVDIGGYALCQLLMEEKGCKRSRDVDDKCKDGGSSDEKRQKDEQGQHVHNMEKNLAKNKAFLVYETARMEVAAKLRVHAEEMGRGAADLFKRFAHSARPGKVNQRKSITVFYFICHWWVRLE